MGDDEQQALPLDLHTDNSFLVSTAIAAVLIAGSAFFCGSHIITARRRVTQSRKQDSSAFGDPDSKGAHDSALVESAGGAGAQTRSAGSSVVDGSDGDVKEGRNSHRSKERRRRGKDPAKELLKSGKKVKVLLNPKPTLRDQGVYGDDSSSKALASSVQIQESDQQKQRRKQEQKNEENSNLQSRRNLSVSSSTRSVSAASMSSALDDGNRTTAGPEWTVASTHTPQRTPHGTEREREDFMSSSTYTLSSSGFSEAGDAQELDTPESQTSELPLGLSEQQRVGEMDMELETPSPRPAAPPMPLPHRSSSGSAITPTASQLAPGADDTTPTLLRGTLNLNSNPTNSNSNPKSKSAADDTTSTNNTHSNITASNNTKPLPSLAKPTSKVPSSSTTTTNSNSKASPAPSSTSSSRRQSTTTSSLDPWDWDGQGSGSSPTPSTSTSANSTAASAESPYRKPPRFQAKRTPSSSSRPGSSSSSLADGGGLRALHTISSDDDSAFPALGSAGSGSSKAGRSRDPSSGPGDAVGGGGGSGNTTTGHRRAPTPRRTPTPSTPPPSLSVQTQLASLRGALEAARIREEKMRTDLETLRWENTNWRRRDLELQAQLHQFMHIQAYNASFAPVSPPATQGGSQPPPLALPHQQQQLQHQSTGSDSGASPSGPHPPLPMPNLHLQMFNQAQMISSPNGLLSPMLSPGPHSPFYPYSHQSYMSPHQVPGMFNTMYPPPPVGVGSGNGIGNSVGPRASGSEPSSVAGSSGSGSPDLSGEPGSRRPDRGRRRTRNWEEGAEGWDEGVPEQEGSASWEDKEGMEGSVDDVEEDAGDSGSEVNEALADAILKRPGSIRLKKKGSRRMEERERVDMDEATEFTFPSLSDLGNVRVGKRVVQEAREIVEDAPSSGPLEVEQPTLQAELETDQLPSSERPEDIYSSAPDSDTAIPHSPVAAQQNGLESEEANHLPSR